MKRLVRLAGLGSSYAIPIVITALVGVFSIPVVIHALGASIWAELAVAQALGLIAGTVVGYGWPVVGPAQVAAASTKERALLYRRSIASRLIILVPVLTAWGTWFLISGTEFPHRVALLVAGVTPTIGALNSVWFFVGESRPSLFNVLDVAPRCLGTIVGMGLVVVWPNAFLFVASQLAGQCVAIAASNSNVLRRYRVSTKVSWFDGVRWTLRSGLSGFVASLTATFYQNLPLILVSNLSPSSLESYAMGDRIYRICSVALSPVTQVAQGRIPTARHGGVSRARASLAIHWTLALATVTVLAFAGAAPVIAAMLSGAEVEVPFRLSIPLGLALGTTLLSSVIGRAILVPLGASRSVAMSALAAAAVGVPLISLGALEFGASGAAAAVAIAEIVALLVLVRRLSSAFSQSENLSRQAK